jgi:hypothetical protein
MFCTMLYHALITIMIDTITNPIKTKLSNAMISSPVSYEKQVTINHWFNYYLPVFEIGVTANI